MTKIALLFLVLVSPGGGNTASTDDPGPAQGKCPRMPTGGVPLIFKVKQPAAEHGPAAREILRAQFPCMKFECTRTGDVLVTIGKPDARKLLGGHVVYSTVKGAGNSAGRDALFVEVKPASFVPEILKEHVVRLSFHDDPKLGYTGAAVKRCE